MTAENKVKDMLNVAEAKPSVVTDITFDLERRVVIGEARIRFELPVANGPKLPDFYLQMVQDEMKENLERIKIVIDRCTFNGRGRVW